MFSIVAFYCSAIWNTVHGQIRDFRFFKTTTYLELVYNNLRTISGYSLAKRVKRYKTTLLKKFDLQQCENKTTNK